MSTEVAAPAAAPATEAPAGTEEAKQPEQGEEQDEFAGLNSVQRYAAQRRKRKEAMTSANIAEKNKAAKGPGDEEESEPPPAAAKDKGDAKDKEPAKADKKSDSEPERDASGRFVPADGKPAKEPEKPAAKAPDSADKERVAEAKADAKDAGVKAPEQKQGESAGQYAARVSQLIREKKGLTAELATAREKLTAAEQRAAEYDAVQKALQGEEIDEEAFFKATGRSFEDFVRAIANGKDKGGAKFKPRVELPAPLAEAKSQIEKELAEIKAWREEQARVKKEADDAKAKADHEAEVKRVQEADHKTCGDWLQGKEDKYPYLSSLDDAGLKLRDEIYARWPDGGNGPEPDISEVADLLETTLTNRLGTIFSSERAIVAALRDPKTRDLVSKALGTQIATSTQPQTRNQGQPKTAPAEGPPTLSNKVPQESSVKAERDPAEESAWVKQQREEEQERAAYHARMKSALAGMKRAYNREA